MISYIQTNNSAKLVRIDRDSVRVVATPASFTVADFELVNTLNRETMREVRAAARRAGLKLFQAQRQAIRFVREL